MSVSGNASRTTSSEKGYTNQELDPWVKSRLDPSIQRAYGLANQPYQPYGGPRVAGFNPTQGLGRGMALGAAGVTATPRPRAPQPIAPAPGMTQPSSLSPGGINPNSDPGPGRTGGSMSDMPYGGPFAGSPLSQSPVFGGTPGWNGGAVEPIAPQDTALAGVNRFLGRGARRAPLGAPDMPPEMDERGSSGLLQPLGRETQPGMIGDGSTPGSMPGAYSPFPDDLGYDDDFTYDPNAAAGAGTLNNAIDATRGVLGMRPDMITAPQGQAAQGRWMGDTPVATFGGAQLGPAATFGGAQLGPAALYGGARLDPAATFGGAQLGPAAQLGGVRLDDPALIGGDVAQADFQGFGGARLGEAAQTQGSQITADLIRRGDIRDVTAGTAAAGIGAYINPFTREVVDAALGDIERQRGVQQVQNDSRAAAARAFGSRSDIVTAETGRAALDASARTAAELRARGFDVALGASMEDQTRALQAQIANMGSDLTVTGRNQDARNTAAINNQADLRTVNLENAAARNRFLLEQGAFDQAAGLNNSNLSAQTSIFNTGQANEGLFRDRDARNRFTLQQGEIDQQREIENARLRSQYDFTQGGYQQQAGLASMDALNNRNLAQGQMTQQAELASMDALNRFGITLGGFQQEAELASMGALNNRNLAQGQMDQQAGLTAAEAINTGVRFDRSRADALEAANVASRNAFALTGMDNSLRAQLANQQTGLALGQLGLAGAASQLGGFAQQQRANALGDAGIVSGLGQGEQAVRQAYLDALYAEFEQSRNYPFLQQQLLNQSLGLVPSVFDSDFKTRGSGTKIEAGAKADFSQKFGLPSPK